MTPSGRPVRENLERILASLADNHPRNAAKMRRLLKPVLDVKKPRARKPRGPLRADERGRAEGQG